MPRVYAGHCHAERSCASSTALMRSSQAGTGAQSLPDNWPGAARRVGPGSSAWASSTYSKTWELAHLPKCWTAVMCHPARSAWPLTCGRSVRPAPCYPAPVAGLDGTELSMTGKSGCDHAAADDGKFPPRRARWPPARLPKWSRAQPLPAGTGRSRSSRRFATTKVRNGHLKARGHSPSSDSEPCATSCNFCSAALFWEPLPHKRPGLWERTLASQGRRNEPPRAPSTARPGCCLRSGNRQLGELRPRQPLSALVGER